VPGKNLAQTGTGFRFNKSRKSPAAAAVPGRQPPFGYPVTAVNAHWIFAGLFAGKA
jgi:hypothetical protein